MASYKLFRITRDVERELTAILPKVKDRRVNGKFISIVRTELSNDYSHCKVYISSINGLKEAQSAAEGLASASGFIKRELSSAVKMRQIPQLHFIPTDSIEYSANISKMLGDLNAKR